jgi:hypothetical protein
LLVILVAAGWLLQRARSPQRSAGWQSISRRPSVEAFRHGEAGAGCPAGCREPRPGCEIKGNVSYRTGERIYHLPGQRWYEETVINPRYGERWFCTEEEAEANGWRRARV